MRGGSFRVESTKKRHFSTSIAFCLHFKTIPWDNLSLCFVSLKMNFPMKHNTPLNQQFNISKWEGIYVRKFPKNRIMVNFPIENHSTENSRNSGTEIPDRNCREFVGYYILEISWNSNRNFGSFNGKRAHFNTSNSYH